MPPISKAAKIEAVRRIRMRDDAPARLREVANRRLGSASPWREAAATRDGRAA